MRIYKFSASVLFAFVIVALEILLGRWIFDQLKNLTGSILYYAIPAIIGIVFPALVIWYFGKSNRFILVSSMVMITLTTILEILFLIAI